MRQSGFGSLPWLLMAGLCLLLAGPGFAAPADQAADAARAADSISQPSLKSYIVQFHDAVDAESHAQGIANAHNGILTAVYRHVLNGAAMRIPEGRLEHLLADARIKLVEEDLMVHASAQVLSTGITRMNADLNTTALINGIEDYNADVDIAILDTGVDFDNPDINVVARVDCTKPGGSCRSNSGDDGNGHGTHVAGIAAAIDNNLDAAGIAPGARVWAVKVLGNDGSGSSSNIIKGIDYVAANGGSIEVANLSLGGLADGNFSAMDTAIANAVQLNTPVNAGGVVFVVAAGNERFDMDDPAIEVFPAEHPDVITVSAFMDKDGKPGGLAGGGWVYTIPCDTTEYSSGNWTCSCSETKDDSNACFSNYGSAVDIMASGTNIQSNAVGGGVIAQHGTSMAAPFVAGAAAIHLINNPGDTPAMVKAALIQAGDPAPCNTPTGLCTDDDLDGIHEPLLLLAPFPDADGDGVLDADDNCPDTSNNDQADLDGDGIGDVCDDDMDGDGVANGADAFPMDASEWLDSDSDLVGDNSDNCPVDANPDQEDLDGDGVGDVCDDCPTVDNGDTSDEDLDGLDAYQECLAGTDPADSDTDNDGLLDGEEVNGWLTDPLQVDSDSDGYSDYAETQLGSDPNVTGDIPPGASSGDVTGDGIVDTRDVLIAQQVLTGSRGLDVGMQVRGDVAPLVGGVPSPNGSFDAGDLLVITRKALGEPGF